MQHPLLRFAATLLPVFLIAASLHAEDKKLPVERTSNELVEIAATAILDKNQIQQELGSDFGGDIVLVRVTVRPLSDTPVKIRLDDFLLVSAHDGQRSEPYAPGQLAGRDVLVVNRPDVSRKSGVGFGVGPIFGGGAVESGDAPQTQTKVEKGDSKKPNPLLETLREKILPEKAISETTTGFLYFQIVGKVKQKDLELHYKSAAGSMALRFHP